MTRNESPRCALSAAVEQRRSSVGQSPFPIPADRGHLNRYECFMRYHRPKKAGRDWYCTPMCAMFPY